MFGLPVFAGEPYAMLANYKGGAWLTILQHAKAMSDGGLAVEGWRSLVFISAEQDGGEGAPATPTKFALRRVSMNAERRRARLVNLEGQPYDTVYATALNIEPLSR